MRYQEMCVSRIWPHLVDFDQKSIWQSPDLHSTLIRLQFDRCVAQIWPVCNLYLTSVQLVFDQCATQIWPVCNLYLTSFNSYLTSVQLTSDQRNGSDSTGNSPFKKFIFVICFKEMIKNMHFGDHIRKILLFFQRVRQWSKHFLFFGNWAPKMTLFEKLAVPCIEPCT